MEKVTKSPEFIEFINGYMTKYALKRLRGDFDKAQDVVQFAWAEAMKSVDFSRSDAEVRDYLIQSVKYVIANDSKRCHATATGIHDSANSIHMSEMDYRTSTKLDNKETYHIPHTDYNFGIAELSADIKKVIGRLSDVEKRYFALVLERGVSKPEAAEMCERTSQWGSQRCQKLARLLNNE